MTPQELIEWHERRSEDAMSSLHCGSENWEYRVANKISDFHMAAALLIQSLVNDGAES